MPKDEKAVRPPSLRAKLNQIRGVSEEEKALLQRVGNLIDVLTFSQRQNQNPRGQRRQVTSQVPTPKNIEATAIPGGIQVIWDPVNVRELDFYEVQVSESTTFALAESFQAIESNFNYRASPPSGLVFFRLRAVTKRGFASLWSDTEQVTVLGNTVFEVDQDHIEPENRTTVSPKPTLVGTLFEVGLGSRAFVGIGAHVGPSPLTIVDEQPAFPSDPLKRNEISYTLFDVDEPFPGLQVRLGPTIGEYIDRDSFYTYSPQFYMHMSGLTSSISDFFVEEALDETQATIQLNVEFLRYFPTGSFYLPKYSQTGIVLNASMANIKF